MHPASVDACPYLTADLPGIGGTIRRYNEDFQVEEIPLYEPCGSGTHVYFGVEKNGLTTWQAVQILARALNRSARDIGYAGLKDAHAVTRQVFSIEHVEPAAVERVKAARIRVLWSNRHTNKLKLGHLRGNRFAIRVRNADSRARERAEAILSVLRTRGVPNYFGPQRFGTRGDNAQIGDAILRGRTDEAIALICGRPNESDGEEVRCARERFDRGDFAGAAAEWPRAAPEARRLCHAMHKAGGDVERAWRAMDKGLLRLYLSAFQSDLFNRVLAARIDELDRVQDGDVAWKHANGAVFLVTDAAVEQARCDAFEISPSGPLFGRRMKAAEGVPGQTEARILADVRLSMSELARVRGHRLDGARRPLRVPPGDATVDTGTDERGAYVLLTFSLPPGSYATSLMREVCKTSAGR